LVVFQGHLEGLGNGLPEALATQCWRTGYAVSWCGAENADGLASAGDGGGGGSGVSAVTGVARRLASCGGGAGIGGVAAFARAGVLGQAAVRPRPL
jgi:hypothetical protein